MKKLTIKEKNILLKDLCTRLPYGVIIEYNNDGCLFTRELGLGSLHDFMFDNAELKPYLRPMSSMTKEEKYTYRHMLGATLNSEGESIMFVYVEDFPAVIDWLLAHHFDYRGLIEEGLALEAPEGMYKTEQI